MNTTELTTTTLTDELYDFPECAASVIEIKTSRIVPNPAQPRKIFTDRSLETLSDSIKRHGVLQPLLVRAYGEKYELIAGERRLRAAIAAGLETVPCIIRQADSENSAEIAIIENLQREDLNMFEEAEAIKALVETCGLTQETAAAHLSCSQSYVTNKMRLLKLTGTQRCAILESGLTERHARALLRLKEDAERDEVIAVIIKRRMNVASAEEYIENYICAKERSELKEKADRLDRDFKRRLLTRDMRLFYNSIDRAVDSVRSCGISVEAKKRITSDGTVIEILVKNNAG